MKKNIYTLLLGVALSVVSIVAGAQHFTPPPTPVCPAVASAAAVQCDLQVHAAAICGVSAKTPGDFGACMSSFMARTPFNCALTTPADRPNCERANTAKMGAAPTPPAVPYPMQAQATAVFVPPPMPVCPTLASPAAVQCDLQKHAMSTCANLAKNVADFDACVDSFMAKTPFNCALTTFADRANCERANAAKTR